MQRSLLTVLVLLLNSAIACAQFQFDPQQIDLAKEKIAKSDPVLTRAANYVISEADKILLLKPGSVMDKAFAPPSTNRHDYMSLAPYFWPDPSKPDSIPYMRKDGQRNPAINRITDKKNLVDLGRNTQILALAWKLTGKPVYAAKAIDWLRNWFVDTATRMNPNLNYAQAVVGVNDGRGIGIIETIALTYVTDAVELLKDAGSFAASDKKEIKTWFGQYLNWMLTSKNGMDEHKALNNHGIWYDMQVMSFMLFTGKQNMAKEYALRITSRVPVQFEPDGRQPLELERTTALGYSTFNLEAWFKTAILAERAGVDLWHYQTPDGRSIQKALDWLIPYATGEKKWPYQQIHEYTEIDKMYFLLTEASRHYPGNYPEERKKIHANNLELTELLYGK